METKNNHNKTVTNKFYGTIENAKTKLCIRWVNGNCRFGYHCNFAHGEHELRRFDYNQGWASVTNIAEISNSKSNFESNSSHVYHFHDNEQKNIGEECIAIKHFVPLHGPNGWTEYRDPCSRNPYYHNHNTQITQWERPVEWHKGP